MHLAFCEFVSSEDDRACVTPRAYLLLTPRTPDNELDNDEPQYV